MTNRILINKLLIVYEDDTRSLPIEVWVDDELVWKLGELKEKGEINGYLSEKCFFCKQIIGLDQWSSHYLNGKIRPHHISCWHYHFRINKEEKDNDKRKFNQ